MKLLNIKPFQETLHKGYCGPAVLKMVLRFYGIEKFEQELAKLAGTTKNGGTDDKALVAVFKKFGLKSKIKNNADFSDIQKCLNKNIPVIVDWFTRGRKDYPDSAVADGHYSIVVGLDKKFIYLQDPEIGKIRKLARDDFLRVWFDENPSQKSFLLRFQNFGYDLSKKVREIRCISLTFFDCVSHEVLKSRDESIFEMGSIR